MSNRPIKHKRIKRSQDVLWLRDYSGDVAGGACTPAAEPAESRTAKLNGAARRYDVPERRRESTPRKVAGIAYPERLLSACAKTAAQEPNPVTAIALVAAGQFGGPVGAGAGPVAVRNLSDELNGSTTGTLGDLGAVTRRGDRVATEPPTSANRPARFKSARFSRGKANRRAVQNHHRGGLSVSPPASNESPRSAPARRQKRGRGDWHVAAVFSAPFRRGFLGGEG